MEQSTVKKYELLIDDTYEFFDVTVFRIKALISFGNVKKGELGGYVEKEDNLCHSGNAWVYDDAKVRGNARVYGNAEVSGDALVFGNAKVYDNALVTDNASVTDNAEVYGDATVSGNIYAVHRRTGHAHAAVRAWCS